MTFKDCHHQVGMKLQKWHLPGLLSLDNVTPGSCLSSGHLKFSKWVFCAYSLGVFQSVAFVLDLRMSGSAHKPFKSGISVPYSSVILLILICLFSQPDVLRSCLSSASPQGQGAYCAAQSIH